MPIDGLTEKQEAFLRQFLGNSIFSRKSDKAKTKAFKNFLEAEKKTQELIDRLRPDAVNVGAIETSLNAARKLNEAGKFDEALTAANDVYRIAGEVAFGVDAAKSKKATILALLDQKTAAPDGALPAEVSALDALRDAARTLLAATVPDKGDMDAAEAKTKELVAEIAKVQSAVDGRAAERAKLLKDQAANATRFGKLEKLMERTKADGDYQSMKELLQGIAATLGAVAMAGAEGSIDEVRAKQTECDGLPARLDALATKIDDALGRLLSAEVANRALSDAQVGKLVELGKSNPEAFAAAKKVLDDLNGKLGDTTIDLAEVEARRKTAADKAAATKTEEDALAALKKELAELAKQHAELVKQRKAARKDYEDHKTDHTDYKAAHQAAFDDPTHKDHAAVVAEFTRLETALNDIARNHNDILARENTKRDEHKAKQDEIPGAEQKLKDAKTDQLAAEGDFKAADAKKRMIDAVTFGPLAEGAPNQLDGKVAADLIGLFGKNGDVADRAVTAAAKAEHPASVAHCAGVMCDKLADGFKTSAGDTYTVNSYLENYANSLIDNSGNYDAAMIAKLDKYIADGRFVQDMSSMNTGSSNEKTKARTAHVGAKAMQMVDGKLNIDGARDAVLDVMFHPEAMRYATPLQANHMLSTLDYLEGSPEARAKIENLPAPSSDEAKGLLARGSGKDAGAIGKADAQLAVVNAMMTPVYQGNVGSCFATSGIVKMREKRPDEALDAYARLATEGRFNPQIGDPVPAIQNVPTDEDPLVRSLEYTAATATARAENARMAVKFQSGLESGLDTLSSGIKSSKWPAVKARLAKAVADSVEYIYNPEIRTAVAADGSSNQGVYQLVTKPGGTVITSVAEYQNHVAPIVEAELKKSDTKFKFSRSDIVSWIDDEFTDALKVGGKYPWEGSSGGHTEEASRVIEDASIDAHSKIGEVDHKTADVPKRTEELLTTLATDFTGRAGAPDMLTVLTIGMHGFNLLPNDPSMAPLLEGGSGKVGENIQKVLVQKGADMVKDDLPADRAAYMFEKEMEAFLADYGRDRAEQIRAEIVKSRPNGPMKPGALKAHVETVFSEAAAKIEIEGWKKREKETTGADPTPEAVNERLEKIKGWRKDEAANRMTNRILKDMGAPQIVLADTNWGDGSSHQFFVVAPDPATGLPKFYKRLDPPGDLREMKDASEWVCAEWQTVE